MSSVKRCEDNGVDWVVGDNRAERENTCKDRRSVRGKDAGNRGAHRSQSRHSSLEVR